MFLVITRYNSLQLTITHYNHDNSHVYLSCFYMYVYGCVYVCVCICVCVCDYEAFKISTWQ